MYSYVSVSSSTDYDSTIKGTLNYFVLVAFGSLLANYIAHVTFNTAAERQIKTIRLGNYFIFLFNII